MRCGPDRVLGWHQHLGASKLFGVGGCPGIRRLTCPLSSHASCAAPCVSNSTQTRGAPLLSADLLMRTAVTRPTASKYAATACATMPHT